MKEHGHVSSKYICPYCLEAFFGRDLLRKHVISEHTSESPPSPEGLIKLTINGQHYQIIVEPQWTLYHLLHDRLGLTGAKMFCDRGACGSCTVIMNGRPILSCMTLAIECDGAEIETIEGIAAAKHPLIDAYVKHHAMQCGYCTPGFIVTAKALLDKSAHPTEQEIRMALSGNLCRCGTYPQHTKAVLEAAENFKKGE